MPPAARPGAWTIFPVLLPILLAGCSPEASEEIAKDIANVILFAMVLSFVMVLLNVTFLLGQLAVIVLNFTRPSRVAMVVAYVLGGLNGLGVVRDIFPSEPAPASSDALVTIGPPDTGDSGLIGVVTGLAWTAALVGSARYAQRRLAAPLPPVSASAS